MNRRHAFVSVVVLASSLSLGAQPPDRRDARPALAIHSGAGVEKGAIAIGDNIVVSATGLASGALYDFLLRDSAGGYVSMLRLSAGRDGATPPQVLLYQSGVVGCAPGAERQLREPYRFRTFAEAEEKLSGAAFTVELRPAKREANTPTLATEIVRMQRATTPRAYFTDARGCLMNATDGSDDIFITASHLLPGTVADVMVVEHEGLRNPGDPIDDVRRSRKTQVVTLREGETVFTVPVWRGGEMPVGTYDVVVRPYQTGSDRAITPFLDYRDIIGWSGDVGIVVFDPHSSHLAEQIAGYEIHTYPWFKHADGFMTGTDVYGALDPKRKPPMHPGTYAAWYVVDHKATWATGDALNDVSGGFEITPIKPGCINGTWTLLWPAASPVTINAANPTQPFDVVIDFGNLSATQGGFVSDGVYTEGTDFVDYFGAVGFYLVRDPRLAGSFPVADVEEPVSGSGCNLDLDGITIAWTDPVFYPAQTFNVAIGDDDMGGEDGRCGMQPTLVDMRAHIWYPKAMASSAVAPGGPFPVVVFYHGQQIWSIPGYLGYDYLGNLLASHGFIVYSIDARSLLNATIASRGEHIRAHMRKLVGMNAMGSGSIFSQNLDLTNVAIAGHSRGGDAVTAAFEWQRVQPDAGYSFKSVIAIAPVQFFDSPGWAPPEPLFRPHLRDVAYMIIHGSKDGDVADFQGLRMYDRAADVRQAGQTTKSMVFVKDANHNYYNTVWETQEGSDYGGAGVLSATDQRDTGTFYIHSAVEAWLKNRPEYTLLLDGTIPYPGSATVALDFQNRAADTIVIDAHEEIPPAVHNAATNTAGGAVTVNGLPDYAERQINKNQALPWNSYQGETWAGTLSWDAPTDLYSTEVTAGVRAVLNPATFTQLTFRVGQVYRAMGSPNPANTNQTFAVRLHDTDGHTSPWVRTRDFATIYPPWENTAWCCIKTVMAAVRIPLQVFTSNTSSQLDLTKLDRIDFGFFGQMTGEIAFDDIRFSK